jgi:hypothetical protein
MSKLWAFGDSALWESNFLTDEYAHETWINIIADELDLEVENHALSGTSIEWVFYTYHVALKNIKKGDVVILGLTSLNRRWVVPRVPAFTQVALLEDLPFSKYMIETKGHTLEEMSAFKYLLNNVNTELMQIQLELFIDAVAAHQKEKEFTVIAMPNTSITEKCDISRPNFINCYGNYYDIAKREVTSGTDVRVVPDPRVNHLVGANHLILAKKYIEAIRHGGIIDLNNGFLERFLDDTDIQNMRDHMENNMKMWENGRDYFSKKYWNEGMHIAKSLGKKKPL